MEETKDLAVTPAPMQMLKGTPPLTKAQEAEMFKALAHKTYKQVGKDFGFQYYYENDRQIVARVLYIVNKIKKAPELWGISEDVVAVVSEAMASRSIMQNPQVKLQKKVMEESFKDKLETARDTAADILMKKLEKIVKDKKSLELVSIRDIKDVLSMLIDKNRLLRGESTDNVIQLSKVDVKNMTPGESLQLLLKAREALNEIKR